MKDIIRKFFSITLPLGGIATITRYIIQGQNLVKEYIAQYQYIIIGALSLLLLWFLLSFGIFSWRGKWLKRKAATAGIMTILLGHYFIANDANSHMFAGDIIVIIGVLIFYLSITGFIVTQKIQQKMQEAKQVIIEV